MRAIFFALVILSLLPYSWQSVSYSLISKILEFPYFKAYSWDFLQWESQSFLQELTSSESYSFSSLSSICNNSYLMAGYNSITRSQSIMTRFLTVPAHRGIILSFTVWVLDNVQPTDGFKVLINSISIDFRGYNSSLATSNLCGNAAYNDIGPIWVSISLNDSTSFYYVSFINDCDDHPTIKSFGFRNISIIFTQSSEPMYIQQQGSSILESNISNEVITTCSIGFYPNDTSCEACDMSCELCSGPLPTECLRCKRGFFYNYLTSTCEPCYPGCRTCYNGSIKSCYSCIEGYYLFKDMSCRITCSGGTLSTKDPKLCTCPIVKKYAYPNGTCTPNCMIGYFTFSFNDAYFCEACPSGQYFYLHNVCGVGPCTTPFYPTANDVSLLCLPLCNSTTLFYYQNTSCASNCPNYWNTTNYISARTCTFPCINPTDYLYWNSSCKPACNYPLTPITLFGFNICNITCLNTVFLYWNGSCISKCPFPLRGANISNFGFCYNDCPNNYLYWNGSCRVNCSFPLRSGNVSGNLYCYYDCPKNFYLYWNGTCAKNCNFPFRGINTTGNAYCYNDCPDNYLYWNGSCLATCDYPLRVMNISQNFYCINDCPTTFLYWDASCNTLCNFPLQSLIIGGNKYCFNNCPADFLYWNGSCLSNCIYPLTQVFRNSRKYCNNICPSSYLFWNATCRATCQFPLRGEIINGNSYCFNDCPDQILYWNGSCLSGCQLPFVFENSSSGKYCWYPCTNSYLYWNGSCRNTCNFPFRAENIMGNAFCFNDCPNDTLFWNGSCLNTTCDYPLRLENVSNKICWNDCSAPNTYLYWNRTCGSSCDFPLRDEEIENNLYCFNDCPTQYLYWNGSCLPSCNFPLFAQIIASRKYCWNNCPYNYLYWNRSCLAVCDPPLRAENISDNLYCFNDCPTQYLYWNGSCLRNCTFPLRPSNITGNLYCNNPCKTSYLAWNGSCISTCEFPLESANLDNNLYCYNHCNLPNYLYWNGSCLSNCTSPLRSVLTKSNRFCINNCPTSYLFIDGKCMQNCSSPLISLNISGNLYCYVDCKDYLYQNQSCLKNCSFPYHVRFYFGISFCEKPCPIPDDYLYWDNKTCSSVCLPFVPKQIDQVNFCTYPCNKTGEYLHWNRSCIKSCDYPMFYENISGLNMCVKCYPEFFIFESRCLNMTRIVGYQEENTPNFIYLKFEVPTNLTDQMLVGLFNLSLSLNPREFYILDASVLASDLVLLRLTFYSTIYPQNINITILNPYIIGRQDSAIPLTDQQVVQLFSYQINSTCSSNCISCQNFSFCLACVQGYQLIEDNKCYDSELMVNIEFITNKNSPNDIMIKFDQVMNMTTLNPFFPPGVNMKIPYSDTELENFLSIKLSKAAAEDYNYTVKFADVGFWWITIKTSKTLQDQVLTLSFVKKNSYLSVDRYPVREKSYSISLITLIDSTALQNFQSMNNAISNMASPAPMMVSFALNPAFLLILINFIQNYYYLQFLNLDIPANLYMFYNLMENKNTYDPCFLFGISEILDPYQQSSYPKFDDRNFGSLFLLNFQSNIVILIFILAGYQISLYLQAHVRRIPIFLIKTAAEKLCNIINLPFLFKIWMSVNLNIVISGCLQFIFKKPASDIGNLSLIVALFFYLVNFVIFFGLILRVKNHFKLDFRQKSNDIVIKELTLDFRKKSKVPFYTLSVIHWKKIFFGTVLSTLYDYPWAQISLIFSITTISAIFFVIVRPFRKFHMNLTSIIDELLLAVCCCIFIFLKNAEDYDDKTYKMRLGFIIIGIALGNLGLNLLISLNMIVNKILQQLKRKCHIQNKSRIRRVYNIKQKLKPTSI